MEVQNTDAIGGSLHIATEVIAKIARLATLEIEGVAEVTLGNAGVRGIFSKVNIQKPVAVEMRDELAEVTVYVSAHYGTKIPHMCEAIQENVKTTIQNMTGITVSKVNVIVTGVSLSRAVEE